MVLVSWICKEKNLLPRLEVSDQFQVGELLLIKNGAPQHIWCPVRHWLDDHFPNRAVSRVRGILWTPCLPDLTLCELWLFWHLESESRVYGTPTTV